MKTDPKQLAIAFGIMRACIAANDKPNLSNDYYRGCALAIAECFDHFAGDGHGKEIIIRLNEMVEKIILEDSK